jgi:hypothetical protein
MTTIPPAASQKVLTEKEYHSALIRRRIRFIVYFPALVRLFKAGTHHILENALFKRSSPSEFVHIKTQEHYDHWLEKAAEDSCWAACTKDEIEQVRWGLFAKVINIIVYEIVSQRELCSESDWQRLRSFLHVPIDSIVIDHLRQIDPQFQARTKLKGMTKDEYWHIQNVIRVMARVNDVPPIWFEAAWSA